VDQRIRQERFEGIMEEARQIQASLLPRRMPRFGDFEIAGRSNPSEIVGGDFYDVIPVSDQILGIAIAYAAGHGLPAALQVRDVYTGLRMGVARDFKIVRTVERLNRIIHDSHQTTRFVSLFYGELETSGNFIYVNAGHNPPLLLGESGVAPLTQTGMVLGPSREASYSRGFVTLAPGHTLLLYTDGIVEARDARGREFGMDRLGRLLATLRENSAEEVVRAVFERVTEFAGVLPAEDDRTVLVVRRRTGPAPPEPRRASAEIAFTPAAR
jgi:sigma-B regulation protein RsbU (phosphoserine phosphatase)